MRCALACKNEPSRRRKPSRRRRRRDGRRRSRKSEQVSFPSHPCGRRRRRELSGNVLAHERPDAKPTENKYKHQCKSDSRPCLAKTRLLVAGFNFTWAASKFDDKE